MTPRGQPRHFQDLLVIAGIALMSFRAAGQEVPIFQIGLIADPQYAAVPNSNSRHYQASLDKLTRAIDSLNTHAVDMVQNLGDIIDRDWDSFDSILPCYEGLMADIPNYHLLGNHDFSIDSAHMPHLLDRLSMSDYYYSYIKDSWRFIVLDATDIAYFSNPLHQHKPAKVDQLYSRTEHQANHHLWNSGIGKKQLRWLRREISLAARGDQRVVVFSHLPVRPLGAAHNLWNDAAIVKVLERSDNVFAYVNGHNHRGEYLLQNGIHYITVCGMVETDVNSFAILQFYHDRCQLVGFGNQPSILLGYQRGF